MNPIARRTSYDKHLYWWSFTMACPIFLLAGQNASLFILASILINFSTVLTPFKYRHYMQLVSMLFAVSAISTTINVIDDPEAFANSRAVLVNYIYWPILLWIMMGIGSKLNIEHLARALPFAMITILVQYLLLNINVKGFISVPTPNSLSLVLICFTAPLVVFLKNKYNLRIALIALAIVLFVLLRDGRRAGSVLTLLSTASALFLPNINIKALSTSIFIFLTGSLFLFTETGEELVLQANPRVHELIYETDKVQKEDRSYLTRRLMIEKGLTLYESSPVFGIGLNNFVGSEVEFKGDFDGSEFVINKDKNNDISAHNSYITLLAEGGLVQLVCLLLIQAFILLNFIFGYNTRAPLENAFMWAFMAVVIHLYFITGIVNVYVWFLFGICLNIITRKSSSRNT